MLALRRRNTVSNRLSHLLPGLAVTLVAALVYLNTLGNGFVYDDHFVVAQNDHIRSLNPVTIFGSEYWSGFASETAGTYYRPVTIFSFALDFALWGQNPSGYHLTNLLLHAANTLLLYLLCARLIRNRKTALFAALLFAVHPVHTEAVANISGRSDLLFTAFGLLAIRFFVSTRTLAPYGAALSVLLACFCKETALLLPVFLVFCDLIWKPGAAASLPAYLWHRLRIRHIWIAAATATFLCFRTLAVGNFSPVPPSPMDNPLFEASFAERVFTIPVLILHYLRLLVFPATLSVDYSFNQIPVVSTPAHPLFLLGTVLLVGLGAAVGRCWGTSRVGIFGVGLLTFPLLLNLNPVYTAGSILAERYLYLPSAGFCLLAGLAALRLLPAWIAHPSRHWACVSLAAALILAGAYRTVVRNQDWRTDTTLFRSAVQVTPNSVRARLNLAFLYAKQDNHWAAIEQYRQVLKIRADYPIVHYKLAESHRAHGEKDRAIYHFEQAVRLKPVFTEAWLALGNLYLNQKREGKAEIALRTALNLSPKLAVLHNQLGVIYQLRGDLDAARAAYEKAIQGNYHHPGVFCNLGQVYAQEGRTDEARRAYQIALKLNPDLAIAHYHLANLYRDEGSRDEAIRHYRIFLQHWKDDARYTEQALQELRSLDASA